MSATFTNLPEAERQVRALGDLYGAARSRVYTGAQADEARLKREARLFSILHIATHGVLDDANPMYSYVLLAGSAAGAVGDNAGAGSTATVVSQWKVESASTTALMLGSTVTC